MIKLFVFYNMCRRTLTHTQGKIWMLLKYKGANNRFVTISHKSFQINKSFQKLWELFIKTCIFYFQDFIIQGTKRRSRTERTAITKKKKNLHIQVVPGLLTSHNLPLSPVAASDCAYKDTSQWFLPRGLDNAGCQLSFCSLPLHVRSHCHLNTILISATSYPKYSIYNFNRTLML